MQRNSLTYTLGVAILLCVVCSLAVSSAAVALRPRQGANEKLDQQKNILDAAGLAMGEYGRVASDLDADKIEELYGWVSTKMVNLETGQADADADPDTWKLEEAMSNPETGIAIAGTDYSPGEERRPKVMKVFFVKKQGKGQVQQVVLPIYGKGLWGTLYGYLAIKSDLKTAQGITFYKHKETPGLGGEVDNPLWKAQWDGVQLFDENGNPAANVFKGPAPSGDPHSVDGLSGATITCRGVTNLVRYWISDDGYGPFLKQLSTELKE